MSSASPASGTNARQSHYRPAPVGEQRRALDLILATLTPEFLDLPERLRDLIPPRAMGYRPSREEFQRRTGLAFDEMSLIETGAQMSLDVLLSAPRLNRIYNQKVNDDQQLGVTELVDRLLARTVLAEERADRGQHIHRTVNYKVVNRLIGLVGNQNLREDARAVIFARLSGLAVELAGRSSEKAAYQAQYRWLAKRIERVGDSDNPFHPTEELRVPPGSPIGSQR